MLANLPFYSTMCIDFLQLLQVRVSTHQLLFSAVVCSLLVQEFDFVNDIAHVQLLYRVLSVYTPELVTALTEYERVLVFPDATAQNPMLAREPATI